MQKENKNSRMRQRAPAVAMLFGILSVSLLTLAVEAETGITTNQSMTELQSQSVQQLPNLRQLRIDKNAIPTYLVANVGRFRENNEFRDKDARSLITRLGPSFRMDGTESIRVRRSNHDTESNMWHLRMRNTLMVEKLSAVK